MTLFYVILSFMLYYVCILSMTTKSSRFCVNHCMDRYNYAHIHVYIYFKQGDARYLCGSLASCTSDWSK